MANGSSARISAPCGGGPCCHRLSRVSIRLGAAPVRWLISKGPALSCGLRTDRSNPTCFQRDRDYLPLSLILTIHFGRTCAYSYAAAEFYRPGNTLNAAMRRAPVGQLGEHPRLARVPRLG